MKTTIENRGELKAFTILEQYGKVLTENVADICYEDIELAKEELKKINHYAVYTRGFFATDRPDLLEESIKKDYFIELDFWER